MCRFLTNYEVSIISEYAAENISDLQSFKLSKASEIDGRHKNRKRCNMRWKYYILNIVVFFLLFAATARAQESAKIVYPYIPIGLNSLPWIIAKEARIFHRHGLDVDPVFVGFSPLVVSMLLSGSADMAGLGGPAIVTNVLKGGDVVFVAAIIPYFGNSLVVRREIKNVSELKGKRVGIGRLGTVAHFALQAILDRYNVTDVTVIQGLGPGEQLPALNRGSIDAAIVSPPAFPLLKAGHQELLSSTDLRNLGIKFIHQGIVARKSLLSKNGDVVVRLIKSTMEGIKMIETDEQLTKKVLTKYVRLTDPDLLDQTYRLAVTHFARDPAVPPEAIQSMVQQLARWNMVDQKAANSTPLTDFYDNRFVDEVKKSGFLNQLWK
jgi:ABC-type nitrate/sulfonate/bicarbonate transport system substrate-binding protein